MSGQVLQVHLQMHLHLPQINPWIAGTATCGHVTQCVQGHYLQILILKQSQLMAGMREGYPIAVCVLAESLDGQYTQVWDVGTPYVTSTLMG